MNTVHEGQDDVGGVTEDAVGSGPAMSTSSGGRPVSSRPRGVHGVVPNATQGSVRRPMGASVLHRLCPARQASVRAGSAGVRRRGVSEGPAVRRSLRGARRRTASTETALRGHLFALGRAGPRGACARTRRRAARRSRSPLAGRFDHRPRAPPGEPVGAPSGAPRSSVATRAPRWEPLRPEAREG